MDTQITAGTVIIDGNVVEVTTKPKYKNGDRKKTFTATYSGGRLSHTSATNIEDAIGSVTITMSPTKENIKMYHCWVRNKGMSIRLSDDVEGWMRNFEDMEVEEDKEIDFNSDIEVTFKGGRGH